LRVQPISWIGAGLLIAAATGIGAWVFGHPFLTSHFQYLDLPVLGRIPLATALVFDLGVFVLVVGATMLMLIALAHQSIRTPQTVKTGREAAPVDVDAAPAPEPTPAADAEKAR
jgi:multicomponent K+:H+ antiporter subunit A